MKAQISSHCWIVLLAYRNLSSSKESCSVVELPSEKFCKHQDNVSTFIFYPDTFFSSSHFYFTKKYILITSMPQPYEKNWVEGLLILYCVIAFLEYSKVDVLKYLAGWQDVFCYCIGKFSTSVCTYQFLNL